MRIVHMREACRGVPCTVAIDIAAIVFRLFRNYFPMPELPEVEVTRRGVAPHLEGRVVGNVTLRHTGLRWPFPPELPRILAGRTVRGTGRRGKYLLVR